jgi:hypothetical protein
MTWVWISAAILLVGAVVPVLFRRQPDRLRSNDEAIAARSRHNQLGLHVETLDQDAPDLLQRARERWITAGGVLASARTPEEFQLAERICDEGLALIAQAGRPREG